MCSVGSGVLWGYQPGAFEYGCKRWRDVAEDSAGFFELETAQGDWLMAVTRYKPRNAVAGVAPRKRPTDWEGIEQANLMRWAHGEKLRKAVVTGSLFDDLWHVPNGGHRHKATAAKLKAEGVKAGIPDLVLDQARGGWHGLRIEMKAKPPHNAAVSPSQKDQLSRSEARGYCCRVALGWEQARDVLLEYLSWPVTISTEVRLHLSTGKHWLKGES